MIDNANLHINWSSILERKEDNSSRKLKNTVYFLDANILENFIFHGLTGEDEGHNLKYNAAENEVLAINWTLITKLLNMNAICLKGSTTYRLRSYKLKNSQVVAL